MLVLSRKENERIKLGDSITVTVVRVTGDKVRLGIEAPANILVLREELEQTTYIDTQPSAANVAGPSVEGVSMEGCTPVVAGS